MSLPRVAIGKTIVRVRTPMNPAFNVDAKRAIGYPDMRWDKQYNCWKIAIARLDDVQRVLFRHYDAIEIREKGKPDRVIDSTGREVRQETLFAD